MKNFDELTVHSSPIDNCNVLQAKLPNQRLSDFRSIRFAKTSSNEIDNDHNDHCFVNFVPYSDDLSTVSKNANLDVITYSKEVENSSTSFVSLFSNDILTSNARKFQISSKI